MTRGVGAVHPGSYTLGGWPSIMFAGVASAIGHIKAGKLKALSVNGSRDPREKRTAQGTVVAGRDPEEFARIVKNDADRQAKVVARREHSDRMMERVGS